MASWDNTEKLKELNLVKETVSLILKFKEKYLNGELDMTSNEFKAFMKSTFETFIKKYETLYKMVLQNDDINMLDMMIEQMTNVCYGNLTLDEVRNRMGEDLAQKYIYPKFGKTSGQGPDVPSSGKA